jgi:hypothetical protein
VSSAPVAELTHAPRAPKWAVACDALAMTSLVLAIAVWIGGGFRVWIGGLRVSMMAAGWPLGAAALFVIVRHAIVPRPHIGTRIRSIVGRVTCTEQWDAAWRPFLATRLAVLVVGLLAVYTIGFAAGQPQIRVSANEGLNLPLRFDAGWYMSVAQHGYMWTPRDVGRQQNIAFFPTYPLAMQLVGRLFGGSKLAFLYAGFALSNIAFLWALVLLYELARSELGYRDSASDAVWLIASYPFSVFYGAVYAESLFLLGVVGAILAFRRRRWGHAAAWGLLVGLTRPNGFLLTLALLTFAYSDRVCTRNRRLHERLLPFIAALAPLAGVASYMLYIWSLTGNPLQWADQNVAWGRTFNGLGPFADIVGFAHDNGVWAYIAAKPYEFINAVPVVCALALVVPIGLRLGLGYAVLVVSNLIPPLLMGGFMSTGRLTATLFPIFLWLAAKTGRSAPTLAVTFAMLQGLAAALFYTWRPLY